MGGWSTNEEKRREAGSVMMRIRLDEQALSGTKMKGKGECQFWGWGGGGLVKEGHCW